MAVAGAVFFLCARDSPQQPSPRRLREYATVLRQIDTLWFCFFYAITFGGFVGLASALGMFLHDQYGVARVTAGDLTALCVFAGSFMRPVGGALADRRGGIRVLLGCYAAVAVLLLGVSTLPPLSLATGLFVVALAVLGAGNGAVFQLVGLRFAGDIGIVTGLVGAAGGLGGFFLPSALGALRDLTGTYATGFLVFGGLCVWAMTLVVAVSGGWRVTWAARAPVRLPAEPSPG
jgi:NNP family nitrate/nitrite transporter-like MFS transporter